MADVKLEINYYFSKVVSFFYNLYGWILSFFCKEKSVEEIANETNNENENETTVLVNKTANPFEKLQKKIKITYYKWCLNIIKQNEMPKHIGFIMDGNRRYARMNNINPYVAHLRGFESLELVCFNFIIF